MDFSRPLSDKTKDFLSSETVASWHSHLAVLSHEEEGEGLERSKRQFWVYQVVHILIILLFCPAWVLSTAIGVAKAVATIHPGDEFISMIVSACSFLPSLIGVSYKFISDHGLMFLMLFVIGQVGAMALRHEKDEKIKKLKAQGLYNYKPENRQKAEQFLSRLPDCDAQEIRELAEAFEKGEGVSVQRDIAVILHSIAGEMGNPKSALDVAHAFRRGKGVQQDNDSYLQWLLFARECGSYDALQELKELETPEKMSSGGCCGYLVAGLLLGAAMS